MFARTVKYFLLASACFWMAFNPPLLAQQGRAREPVTMAGAVALLEDRSPREALEAFRTLERQGSVIPALDYYLGRALHLTYDFNEAIRYYQRFGSGATRQERKDYRIDQLIESCRNALQLTATYNPYEVMNVTFLDLADSAQFSQVRMKGGQLQYKPRAYVSEEEERDDLTGLMFLSPGAVRGEYAYFSGYERNGKDGAQLFRIRKGTGNSWSEPEGIRALNTSGNEILPYFDPIENDLYFASDGLPGIGGFDLYRSHYDMDRDEWSPPMNLGFPINSVMDEVLLLPGSDLGMLMFFSNRQGPDSMWTVYRIHVIEPKRRADVNDPEMLAEIASMEGVADEILAELEALKRTPVPTSGPKQPIHGEPPGAADKVITTAGNWMEEARQHQARSDSLRAMAVQATIRVRESDDPNDRWVWQKQIMLWEKRSRDEEARADSLLARLEREETRALMEGNIPPTIETDTVIGGIRVYRFTEGASLEGEPGTPAPLAGKGPGGQSPINRFDILDHPTYSGSQPVPMDVPIPPGTYYRIQLGVFSSEVEGEVFLGITPITGERLEDRGLVRYYAGKFSRYADASGALERVRDRGFSDAFIVSWYNGRQVPTHTAKQLE